jgi:hypothetical protein
MSMNQLIKDFTNDVLKQLFGWTKPRVGKIILTRYTRERMREYGLDFETLEDVFRHGQGHSRKIVQKYANVIVGLYYKVGKSKSNPSENINVITTCWKRKRYYRRRKWIM